MQPSHLSVLSTIKKKEMNSRKYLVKLTPHHQFFFGGESSFGGDDGAQANYLVKSSYMPQQTGLLGLVRHQLLLQNGLLDTGKISDKTKASLLIGPKSFRIGEEDLQFGVIKKISPMMLTGKNDYYFPTNLEYQFDKETDEPVLRKFIIMDGLPLLEDFDPKNWLSDWLVNRDMSDFKPFDQSEKVTSNGFFSDKQQVGIRKNYKGVTDEKAYYLQTFKKLTPGYSFAFLLELNKNFEYNAQHVPVCFQSSDVVIFGGEQSSFKMEVSAANKPFDELAPKYPAHEKFCKIVLLSDTKLKDNQLFDDLVFAISETTDFRFLETSVAETKNYAGLAKNGSRGKLTKSKGFKLLKKGSVLYYEEGEHEKVVAALDNPVFQMIGYNHYKVIKPDT